MFDAIATGARIGTWDNTDTAATSRQSIRASLRLGTWDLQSKITDSRQVEAGADLRAVFSAAIESARREGGEPVADAPFGFVFLERAGERRLIALTPRDPHDQRAQNFSPFR